MPYSGVDGALGHRQGTAASLPRRRRRAPRRASSGLRALFLALTSVSAAGAGVTAHSAGDVRRPDSLGHEGPSEHGQVLAWRRAVDQVAAEISAAADFQLKRAALPPRPQVAVGITAGGDLVFEQAAAVAHNLSYGARPGHLQPAVHPSSLLKAHPTPPALPLRPAPPHLVDAAHHHLHESVLSHALGRPTGPRRIYVDPDEAASLDDLTARERQALMRRATGVAHPTQDPASDLSLMRMADGVGTLTYDRAPTSNERLNRELRRRLVAQDVATIVMLVLVFLVTILVSCMNVYHFSEDPSPVAFYSDPKMYQQRLMCASAEPDAFLNAFNVQPTAARLRLVGRSPGASSPGPNRDAPVRRASRLFSSQFIRRNSRERRQSGGLAAQDDEESVIFDVALDLTPFITGQGRLSTDEDLATLERHLHADNPLEVLVLVKKVEWPGWEDVATNIRQHLRSMGFQGDLEVRLEAKEELLIYRNHPWQNFVRNRVTQCIVVLSVIGALFWVPYLWARSRTVRVESKFEVNLDLERYWELLADGLHAQDGFQGAGLMR